MTELQADVLTWLAVAFAGWKVGATLTQVGLDSASRSLFNW